MGAYFGRVLILEGCLFWRGAYFHGVLINSFNFLVACSSVRTNKLVVRPRVSFLLISVHSFSTTRDTVRNRSIIANFKIPFAQ